MTMDDGGDRLDERAWPERAWIMAGLLGAMGLAFGLLVDRGERGYADPLPIWRQLTAAFLFVTGIATVLVTQPRRWRWAAIFAVATGLVVARVGWSTVQYNTVRPSLFEWSFLSALFAALLAAPLFQTVRDEGRWRFPYRTLHLHAWTDAVIGAAGLAFVGLSFLVTALLGALLHLIGIDFIQDALREGWFGWLLAGTAFGAASGILRESDRLLATLLKVVLVVLSILAPVFAAGITLFLVALPFTGLQPLWETDSATPILLICAAGGVVFVNAVIGNGRDERTGSRILHGAAMVLAVTILPLAMIAAVSMGQRIGQYGWTPERLWAAVTVLVGIAYGAAYLASVAIARRKFDDRLRPLNTRLAIATCGLAILLATPFVDFGGIATRSQVARLDAGKVTPEEFDFWALKEDFGPTGRRALQALRTSKDARVAAAAKASDQADNRYQAGNAARARSRIDPVRRNLTMADGSLPSDALVKATAQEYGLCTKFPCIAVALGGTRYAVVGNRFERGSIERMIVDSAQPEIERGIAREVEDEKTTLAPGTRVEVRGVERRQVFVDGKPVGEPFE
ncbi:DUF4153 domain-containing protein [Sphingorhabdus soli]|uniref:DUF4153 domain-containing protein n=1 Tax=Flavisphingopyxis soli TaxID=2601267 RepID=A0A5C6U7P0_9SPHN|nr:DUF4153 domain-containing protein [Sphingorhabdus soli]TXC68997.1 DUF4153 domain-containing protein [Sphingorhabdus soli]